MSTEPIDVGETIKLVNVVHGEATMHTAQPSCGENRGQWICVTHGEIFPNNIQKDGHIGRGQHRLGWLCWDHGLEAP